MEWYVPCNRGIAYSNRHRTTVFLATINKLRTHNYCPWIRPPSHFSNPRVALSQQLETWMSSNRLRLNPAKTKFMWFGTRQQLAKLNRDDLANKFPSYTFSATAR